MGSQPLPSSVEQLLEAIRREKSTEPADAGARSELARIGEEEALEILRRISQSRAIRKSLSAYIIFMVKKYGACAVRGVNGGPRTPERMRPEPAYSQESVNFSGPSNFDFGENRDDPSIASIHSRTPLQDVLLSQQQTPSTAPSRLQDGTVPERLLHNVNPARQPICTVAPSQPDNIPSPAQPVITAPQCLIGCGTPPRQPVEAVTPGWLPTTVPTVQPQQPPSAVMEALGELEFRKAFLILSYVGRKNVDDMIPLHLIAELKGLGMSSFERKLWDVVRKQCCIPESDRRKNFEWNSKRTCIYHCHVELNGCLIFKGPFLQETSTHLHQVLGDDNVLLVKFAATHDQFDCYPVYHAIAEKGIFLGLRRYQFFVFKDGGKEERTKSPTSSPVKCYFVRTESNWRMDANKQYILNNKSMQDARGIFMNVHKLLPEVQKYMARFSLILSKTIKLDVDFASIIVRYINDIPCMDEDGQIVDGEILTDGTGFISEDLAMKCPRKIYKGRYVTPSDIQNLLVKTGAVEGDSSLRQYLDLEPPLLMQIRLFHYGAAAKGTLLVDKRLPSGTIEIRDSMVKVDPDKAISRESWFNSLEVVGTSHLFKRARLSKSIIALLSHGGVSEKYFLDLTMSAILDAKEAQRSKKFALRVAISHGNMDDFLVVRMILCGMPLDEPYLEFQLSIMMKEELKGIKAGRIPMDDCYYLMGTADPTGRLGPNEVCIILGNGQVSGKVLVYKHPGLHFGDIHVLNAVYVEDIEQVVGNAKFAIFFPIKGRRSLADEMANSDYDGDLYWVSTNPQFLAQFKPSRPWSWSSSPKPRESRRKQLSLSDTDWERTFFQLFLDTRFKPSYTMGEASDCWMAYMDRMLTPCVGDAEKKRLCGKILELIDIYYLALDAPKKGLKVEVPSSLKSEKFPHYLERSKSSFHSISILGLIYDKVASVQEKEPHIDVLQPLPCLSDEPPQDCMTKWKRLYVDYRKDMALALKETDEKLKKLAAEQVIQKYKMMLYGAEEFGERSNRSKAEVFDEALAIYHIVYNNATKVSSCSFAWKTAGRALCELYADKQIDDVKIVCLKSVLHEVMLCQK